MTWDEYPPGNIASFDRWGFIFVYAVLNLSGPIVAETFETSQHRELNHRAKWTMLKCSIAMLNDQRDL